MSLVSTARHKTGPCTLTHPALTPCPLAPLLPEQQGVSSSTHLCGSTIPVLSALARSCPVGNANRFRASWHPWGPASGMGGCAPHPNCLGPGDPDCMAFLFVTSSGKVCEATAPQNSPHRQRAVISSSWHSLCFTKMALEGLCSMPGCEKRAPAQLAKGNFKDRCM